MKKFNFFQFLISWATGSRPGRWTPPFMVSICLPHLDSQFEWSIDLLQPNWRHPNHLTDADQWINGPGDQGWWRVSRGLDALSFLIALFISFLKSHTSWYQENPTRANLAEGMAVISKVKPHRTVYNLWPNLWVWFDETSNFDVSLVSFGGF